MIDLDAPFPGPLPNQLGLPGFPPYAVAGQPCCENLRPVAAICVASISVYHSMPGVIAFNEARDARNFPADRPAVYHPPCRSWSRSYSKIAKPKPGERELGLLCCDWLKRTGGVLEQPAYSALFEAGGLPRPGETIGHLQTIEVLQSWWGFPTRKRTWLCFSGVDVSQLDMPFALNHVAREGLCFERMSQKQRSHTTESFAAFLINAARSTAIKHRHTLSLPAELLQRCQPKYDLICDWCGLRFVSHRQHAATCSDKCRKAKSRTPLHKHTMHNSLKGNSTTTLGATRMSLMQLLIDAINSRTPITATYKSKHRVFCPHVVGHKNGAEHALMFQTSGQSQSGLSDNVTKNWRCVLLNELADVALAPQEFWFTAPNWDVSTQQCVDDVLASI